VRDLPIQSISVEDTFEQDVLLAETEPMIRRLAEKLWSASRNESRIACTVVLKMKTSEFRNSDAQPYPRLTSLILRGVDGYCA